MEIVIHSVPQGMVPEFVLFTHVLCVVYARYPSVSLILMFYYSRVSHNFMWCQSFNTGYVVEDQISLYLGCVTQCQFESGAANFIL